MISALFHTLVYDPLYNGLIFLVDVVPGHDVGIAVISLTLIVRVLLIPLSRRAIETQKKMKEIAPEVEKIKEKYKDKREEQGRALLALYKERNVRPFASMGLVFLQIPIIIGLYLVFARGGLPAVDASVLYSFVELPTQIDMVFLGLIAMDGHSLFLAALVLVTQFIYMRLSMGPRQKSTAKPGESFSADMARTLDLQMRYFLPVMMGVFSYFIVAAAPLYWVVGNLFMIGQEFAMGRRF